ncbi:hypothetical protein KOR34_26910 [Posidoniimonas corsicana]|uniref:Bacterial SH3 domain protein n=1 Tax=Posidoniimonas corsicana TaxID=1938618 RepID=A0A5C5VGD3_9BACT|nr:SH3 domain-containing protein [Posidoniimonas corsicana]TWT37728.1 hypothetical protein KOR34_26910 [Posidoniimonas corsicana]
MLDQSTRLAAIAVACSLLPGAARGGEDGFPYEATVIGAAATVYAGPGPHYYNTAELPRGARVQVYEETASGFCAVRPPEGSFSWASASALRLLGDGTAEVTRDQTPARVGSLLHNRRDAVHVRLDQGERVRVLAEQPIDGVDWVQIAPPSGEFRWVRRSDLTTDPTHQAAGDLEGSSAAVENQQGDWVQAAAHTTPAEQAPPPADAPGAEVVGAKPLPPASPPGAGDQPAATAMLPRLSGEFRDQLGALEVELSRQVSERPNLWRFDEIERRAAEMLAAAGDESERNAVRDLAARVDRFASIANRYRATRGVAPQVGLTRSSTPDATPPTIERIAESVTPLSGYDAVGTLRPVVSKRPNAPQYALVDTSGEIVSFITAGPDLNLGSLIGKRVGVQGVKGYMPEYQRSHVAAQRVASLTTAVR